MNLDNSELNTILAALRFYQRAGMGEPCNRPDWLQDLACATDDDTSLDDSGIDALCERINHDDSNETGNVDAQPINRELLRALSDLLEIADGSEVGMWCEEDKEVYDRATALVKSVSTPCECHGGEACCEACGGCGILPKA